MPEGHQPRGTTLGEALRGNLTETEGSAGVSQRGLSKGSVGLCRGLRDFPRFYGGSDPMLSVTRRWRIATSLGRRGTIKWKDLLSTLQPS